MKTYSLTAAAEYLNAGESTVIQIIANGDLPAAKIGQGYVIREDDLDKYLRTQVDIQTAARLESIKAGQKPKVETGFRRSKNRPTLEEIEKAA